MNDDLPNGSANRDLPSTWTFAKARSPSAESTTLRDEAAAYVRSKTGQAGTASIDGRLAAIRKAATTVTKASRAQHHEAVALAYALYLAYHDEPDFKGLIVGLAASAGLRVTKATDPLAIIVGSLITYGGGSDAVASRKLRSRDVQAIRYLIRKRVAQESVAAEAAKKREGLDAWARRSAQRATKSPSTKDAAKGSRAAAKYRWQDDMLGLVELALERPLRKPALSILKQAIKIAGRATTVSLPAIGNNSTF